MLKYRLIFFLVLIFIATGNLIAQTNYDCMMCHEDAYRKSSHRGDSVYVYVDKNILPQSVHKDVSCKACHKDAAGRFPHKKKLDLVNCGNCHKEQLSNFNADLHGQALIKGDKNAPTCKECHGDHAIFPSYNSKSRTNKINIPILCGKCHKDSVPAERGDDLTFTTMFDNFSQEIHGQGIQYSGLKVTATCNDCHSNHNVYNHNNPLSKVSEKNITKTCSECHGKIEEVHRNYIRKDVWKNESESLPTCSECHISHKSGSGKLAESEAKNVVKPQIEKCGSCHFYGNGSGKNVKYGDLSDNLYNADKHMDVHMDKLGTAMECADCHKTEEHDIKKELQKLSNNNSISACEQCHDGDIHKDNRINRHTSKIACQTCHITTYAKSAPSNLIRDLLLERRAYAKNKNSKGYDSLINLTYKSRNGYYPWATNVEHAYAWFNGITKQYVPGDEIKDTSKVLILNTLFGSYGDYKSKIIPVKIFKGKQLFDTKNKMLIPQNVHGYNDTILQHDISEAGKKKNGSSYSEHYSFVTTKKYHPLNHLVSPANEALKCIDCHSKNGVLKGLNDFYMPGRDRSKLLDIFSVLMIIGAFGGILLHSMIRVLKSKNIL